MPSAASGSVESKPAPGTAWKSLGVAGIKGLHAVTRRIGSAVVVCVAGDIDASNEGAWAQLLTEMAASTTPPHPLVVDVRNVDFMGCCAFTALEEEAKRCRDRGVSLCLVSYQPVIDRTVDVCGLRWVLPIYPTIEAALLRAAVEASDGGKPW